MKSPSFIIKHQLANTSIKCSPFNGQLIALTSASNFGIVGVGKVQILVMQNDIFKQITSLNQKDAMFDVSWTEFNQNLLIAVGGNGSIILWDYQKGPQWRLQTNKQIQSVQCSFKGPLFVTTSIDGAIRVGNAAQGKIISAVQGHLGSSYCAAWHPNSQSVYGTIGADGFLKLWDLKSPNTAIAAHKAHEGEILSMDFSKYQQMVFTSSNDKTTRMWDLRNLKMPVNVLIGHRYPIRKVKCSPHHGNIVATGSYDMNVNIYDIKDPIPLKFTHSQHTQFVTSLDFNLYDDKMIVTTSWDGRTIGWHWNQHMPIVT